MSLTINNIKTFPMGGVHPAENKYTAGKPIEKLEAPKQVSIPISQHIGAPAKPVVEQREKVKVGQVIAKSAGFVRRFDDRRAGAYRKRAGYSNE